MPDLKTTILDTLEPEQLGWYLDAYELSRRPAGRQAVVARLAACEALTVAQLLESLYEVDVKRACEAVGVSPKGRRGALVERLLASGAASTAVSGARRAATSGPSSSASRAKRAAPPEAAASTPSRLPSFVALDFETADHGRDSACAVAVVRVDGGRITGKAVRFIRPPRTSFAFTYVHGITWARVRNEPSFGEVWRDVQPLLEGVDFIAAHNASFDRSVLKACCESARTRLPDLPFECTVKLARQTWNLYPTKLPDVCRHLGIPLTHHDAGSDAEACARIVIAARA